MTESRRQGAEQVTNPLVRQHIREGLAGVGENQYEFANELGDNGRRAPGKGTQISGPSRATNIANDKGDYGG